MNKKLVGFRLPEEIRNQIVALQAERKESKTQVVISAVRRLYLYHLKERQKGKTEELAAIQLEIEQIENVGLHFEKVKKVKEKHKIKVVNSH